MRPPLHPAHLTKCRPYQVAAGADSLGDTAHALFALSFKSRARTPTVGSRIRFYLAVGRREAVLAIARGSPLPRESGVPHTTYLIFFTPRSGSYLMCEALKASGVAGFPGEYFSAPQMHRLGKQWGVSDQSDYLEMLLHNRTTANPVMQQYRKPLFNIANIELRNSIGPRNKLMTRLFR